MTCAISCSSSSMPIASAAEAKLLRATGALHASISHHEDEVDLPRGSLLAPTGTSRLKSMRAGEQLGCDWLDGKDGTPSTLLEGENTEHNIAHFSSTRRHSTNNTLPRDPLVEKHQMQGIKCSRARGVTSTGASCRFPPSASERSPHPPHPSPAAAAEVQQPASDLQCLRSVLAVMNLEQKLQLLTWQKQESERKCLEFVDLLDRQASAMEGREGGGGIASSGAIPLCHGADDSLIADSRSSSEHLTACRATECHSGRSSSCNRHVSHSLSNRRSARGPSERPLHSPSGGRGMSHWIHSSTTLRNNGLPAIHGDERSAMTTEDADLSSPDNESSCAHSWTGISLERDRLFYQPSPSTIRRLRKARSNPLQRRHHRMPLMTSAAAHGIPLHMHVHIPRMSSTGAHPMVSPASPTHRQAYALSASPTIHSPTPRLWSVSPSAPEPLLSPTPTSPVSLCAHSPRSKICSSRVHGSMRIERSPLSVNCEEQF